MLSHETRGHKSQQVPWGRAKAPSSVGDIHSVISHMFTVPGAGDAAVNKTDAAPGLLECMSL